MNIGDKSQIYGADGIGVGFHPGDLTAVGSNGGALGFGGLSQTFGWKADTWWNGKYDSKIGGNAPDPDEFKGSSTDSSGGHGSAFGSFVYTDADKTAISYDESDAPAQQIAEPKDNQFLPFTLSYTGATKTLTISYGGKTWTKNVTDWMGQNLNEAFFIAASTGGYKNLQQIQVDNFSYTSKDNQANIDGQDVTIHVGDPVPSNDQFQAKATDKDGNPINVTIDTSKVDPNIPGDYDVLITATDGQTKTVQVHVLDNTKINAHDTTITQGDTWSPADSFDSATDDHGQNIPFTDITVSGADKVDINTSGTYQVTYTTKDGTSKTITVTVTAKPVTPPTNDEKGTINAHDSEIDKGTKFDAQDNFDSATNANGNQVDWNQIKVTGADKVDTNKPGDYQVTYSFTDSNGHLISKTVTVTVNDSDDVNNGGDGDGHATQPNGGKPFKVYAKTSINEYSSDTFTEKGKKKHYVAKNRVYAPIFTVKKVVTNKNGRDRYLLDNGRYITANTANINYLYWQSDSYKQLYVIHPQGTYEYKSATFAKKNRVKLHHQGEVLKVKKVIHHGLTTRYQLTNGNYVSGNKQWTSPNKWSFPKRVKAVGAINVYKTPNLTGKVKHYKAKSHQVFTVKGLDYSHGFENRGYSKRYKVGSGYISANPKIVKEVK